MTDITRLPDNDWGTYTEDADLEDLRNVLVGRKVVRVSEEQLRLDDGRVLTLHSNEGCGGCGAGWYELETLNDCPDNAIMDVQITQRLVHPEARYDETETISLFVLAQDTRIELAAFTGHDNGYYGRGFWIEVTNP